MTPTAHATVIAEPTAAASVEATTAVDPAADLIDRYRPGTSFFFGSPRRALLALGSFSEVPADTSASVSAGASAGVSAGGARALADRAAGTLREAEERGHPRPLIVGVVPFDPAAATRLTVPVDVRWTPPLRCGVPAPLPAAPGPAVRPLHALHPLSGTAVRAVPEPDLYRAGVRRAVARLRAGDLEKVVLARSLQLDGLTGLDPRELLRRLAAADPEAYVYGADLPGDRTLVGASPELLVRRSGAAVLANPLAGSAPRADDPAEDRRRAAALLGSAKDRREHAVVVDAVRDGLRPFCRDLDAPAEPALVRTATMWHLSTRVTGHLTDPGISSLTLALALHPTPAVCGTPATAARRLISEIEPFDRGFYSGAVGWCDSAGDGEWAVAIRCAEVSGDRLSLFAGAGIVADSDPAAELAETSAKFRTLLLALGLDREL